MFSITFRVFIIAFASSTLVSCALSVPRSSVEITTDPLGAEVYLLERGGSETKLGETPITLDQNKIQSLSSNFVGFKFQKEGFEVERVYIDLPSRNLSGSLKVTLKNSTDWSQAFVDKKASKYLDDVARMTAEIQGAMAGKDFSRAETKARALVGRYPNLAVGWSLLGNVLFLQNRKSEAMESYNRALGIDPTNQETKNVLERMKGIQ